MKQTITKKTYPEIIQTSFQKRVLNGMLFFFLFTLIAINVNAQSAGLNVIPDRRSIKIGEQINVNCEIKLPPHAKEVLLTAWPDSVEHFELIQKDKPDSIKENSVLVGIKQHLIITSFDSGNWKIPSLQLSWKNQEEDSIHRIFSDSILIGVNFTFSDTTGQLKDIKPIREVVLPDHTVDWIIAISAGVLVVMLLIYFMVKRRKSKKAAGWNNGVNPFEEALSSIKLLEEMKVNDPESILLYHSKLSEILRRYLTRKIGGNFFIRTSGDILLILRNNYLDSTMFSELAAALRMIDVIKFAKFLPQETDSRNTADKIRQVIQTIESVTLNKQA